jgi:hypothetical protein
MKFMKLTFSEWSVKLHVSAVVRALFNLNVHFRTLFSVSDERDVTVSETALFCLSVNLYPAGGGYLNFSA